MGEGTTAVLLLQMGGPETIAAIRPFLRELFLDPAIVPLPGPAPVRRALAGLISFLRSHKVAPRYEAIGGGSPLVATTRVQAAALETWLRARKIEVQVRAAMRYCPPRAAVVVAELPAGIERLLLVSLYPHYSRTTTGSSLAEARSVLKAAGFPEPTVIDRWGDRPDYHRLLATRIATAVDEVRKEVGDAMLVLFSAHGLPEKLIAQGDPYLDEIRRTVDAVAARLPGLTCRLAFQSRVGPVQWIGPETGDTIRLAAAEGVRGLVVVPISFVSDHIETLYDMDLVQRRLATEAGITRFHRLPAFNADPDFIDLLGAMVTERLAS